MFSIAKSITRIYRTTLDEAGPRKDACYDVEIEYYADTTEPRTYDSPGAPAYVELRGVYVTSYCDETTQCERHECHSHFFELHDERARDHVEADWERIKEQIIEELNGWT